MNFRILLVVIVSVCSFATSECCFAGNLDQIEGLLATTREQSRARPLVHVRGCIIALGEGIATRTEIPRSLCVEDDTAAIWVSIGRSETSGIWTGDETLIAKLKPGMIVEITGRLDEGAFAPVLLLQSLSILKESNLPEPKSIVLEKFLRGGYYLKRTTVQGVVQSVVAEPDYGLLLKIETGLGHFLCRLPKRPPYDSASLLDAEVRITGVAAVTRNWRGEFVCPRMIVQQDEDFEITARPNTDPFSRELVPVYRLNSYSLQGTPLHRIHVKGVVTYADNTTRIFIQDGEFAIRIDTIEPQHVFAGDVIEAVGFVNLTDHVAGLGDAMIKVDGSRVSVSPVKIKFNDIYHEYKELLNGKRSRLPGFDGMFIELEGTVLSHQFRPGDSTSSLEIDCENSTSTAYVNGTSSPIRAGTRVRLKGIAQFQYATQLISGVYTPPVRLDLLVSDKSRIHVVSSPPWWSIERVLYALMATGGLVAVVGGWAIFLRRALLHKTSQLINEIKRRHDASVEFQAALRERTRLAANLHDTILQTITGLSYQLEACIASDKGSKQRENNLLTAQKMVARGQSELRSAVWALRAMPVQNGPFANSVRNIASRFVVGEKPRLNLECDETIQHLADFVAGNLLLIIQEAVSNSLKHARAENIKIVVKHLVDLNQLEARISDDGIGFDITSYPSVSEGHFGIQGIRERVERLSGKLHIVSEPMRGTTIIATVPLLKIDEQLEIV